MWPWRLLCSILRTCGGACGLLTTALILADLPNGLSSYYDVCELWIRIPLLANRPRALFLLIVSLVLSWSAIHPLRARALRFAAGAVVGSVAAIACSNAVQFYQVLARGAIRTPAIVPTSVLVAAFFAALCVQILRGSAQPPRWTWVRTLGFATTCVLMAAAFPVLLIFTFGPTDYRRNADCAVVFGAAVRPGGVPSPALADRVDAGILLYKQGRIKKLIVSGGIDPTSSYSEPRVMRTRALASGVPERDIVMDLDGNNTAATVRNTARYMREQGYPTVLAVSHYYHLPRITMLFRRTDVRAYTVPARMTHRLSREPYYIAREVAAFYNSYLFQKVEDEPPSRQERQGHKERNHRDTEKNKKENNRD